MASLHRAPALLVVRSGNSLTYFHDRALSEAYIAKLALAETPTLSTSSSSPSSTSSALLGFGSEFLEIAHLAGGDCHSACTALASVRPRLGHALGNAVRGLLRARGAVAHPVACDKPMRVLREVREALLEHVDHPDISSLAGSVEDARIDPTGEEATSTSRLLRPSDVSTSPSTACSRCPSPSSRPLPNAQSGVASEVAISDSFAAHDLNYDLIDSATQTAHPSKNDFGCQYPASPRARTCLRAFEKTEEPVDQVDWHLIRHTISKLIKFRDAYAVVYAHFSDCEESDLQATVSSFDCGMMHESLELQDLASSIAEELDIADIVSEELAKLYSEKGPQVGHDSVNQLPVVAHECNARHIQFAPACKDVCFLCDACCCKAKS